MKPIFWLAPLLLASGLAAQEIGTSLIDPMPAPTRPAAAELPEQEIGTSLNDPFSPTEEVNLSPFWDNAEAPRATPDPFGNLAEVLETTVDAFSTVVRRQKLDPTDSPGPPLPVMGHTMVFRTEDRSVVLEAVAGGREAEPALFERLLAMENEGPASVVMEHQIMTLGGRAASASLIRAAVYPTEFEPLAAPLRLYPTAFETRQLGDSAFLTPRFRDNGIHVIAQAAAVRWSSPTRWPVIDPAMPPGPDRMIFNVQPQILVDECTTTALAQPGEPRLLGIAREARAVDDTTSAPAWRLSFLRLQPLDDTAPPAEASPNETGRSVRCDVMVFRLPLDEATAWVWQSGPRDDTAAWDALMARVRTGEVTVSAQWSVAGVTGPVRPGGPPEASVSSLSEFIYPTEHLDFAPTAWETRNTGTSCRVCLRTAADGQTLVGRIDTEELRLDRLRRWPSSATDPDVCLLQPEFVTRDLRTDLALPANGITFLGLCDAGSFGAAAEDTEAMADLYFVKSSADPLEPRANAPIAPPVVEWRTLVFSVDDAAASDLQPLLVPETAAIESDPSPLLWQWAADGRAHVRHTAAVVIAAGGSGSVTHLTQVIYPTASQDKNGFVAFDNYLTQDTGLRLSIQPTIHADRQTVTAALDFAAASAPPRIPELAAYRQAMEAGVRNSPIPEFFDTPEATQKSQVTLPTGTSRLLRLEKARAPAGSPEHGRWHAVLVSAIIRGG